MGKSNKNLKGRWKKKLISFSCERRVFKGDRIFPSDEAPKTVQGKIFRNILKLYFPLPRVFPNYVKPYGGSSLSSLTPETIKCILDFVNDHPDYIKFHEYSFCPDEIFFQTILLNSNKEKISVREGK